MKWMAWHSGRRISEQGWSSETILKSSEIFLNNPVLFYVGYIVSSMSMGALDSCCEDHRYVTTLVSIFS